MLDKACFTTIAGTKALTGAATTATKAAATVVAFMMLACHERAKRQAIISDELSPQDWGRKALDARVGCRR